jgi:hypothetical protein
MLPLLDPEVVGTDPLEEELVGVSSVLVLP